jgi:hypothetical protein
VCVGNGGSAAGDVAALPADRSNALDRNHQDRATATFPYAASARIDTALGGVQVGVVTRRVFLDCQARAHRAHAIGLTIDV